MRRNTLLGWGAVLAAIGLCAAVAGVIILLARQGSGSSLLASRPAAANLYTSQSAMEGSPSSEFSQADVIFTHFTLEAGPNERMLVKAALKAVEVEGLESETQVASTQGTFSAGPDYIQLSSGLPWLPGRYQVDLSVNDVALPPLDITVNNSNTTGARLVSVYASTDQAGEERTEIFPPVGSIYIQFSLADAPDDTAVRGVLIARQASGLRANTQITETNGRLGTGAYWFEFFSENPWPEGEYTVFVYLNNQLAGQVDLQVR